MVGTIIPMVRGEIQDRHHVASAGVLVIYTAASCVGAGALGVCVGAAGWLISPAASRSYSPLIVGLLLIVGSICFVTVGPWSEGRFGRQVPAQFRCSRRPWKASVLFGLELGFALSTGNHGRPLLPLILVCVILGDMWMSVIVFVSYGIGRSIPLIVLAACDRTPEDVFRRSRTLPQFRVTAESVFGFLMTCFGSAVLAQFLSQ